MAEGGYGCRPTTPASNDLESRIKKLPYGVQSKFYQMVGDLYEQETDTMISFIEDARRSLALSVDELKDEQEVLSLTSRKITESRMSSARSSRSIPSAKKERTRIGASARRQRLKSAAASGRTPGSAVSTTPRPDQTIERIMSARISSARSARSATSMSLSLDISQRTPTPNSSMDSVTFESERNACAPRSPTDRHARSPDLTSNRNPVKTQSSPKMARPGRVESVPEKSMDLPPLADDDFQEERDEIMSRMSGEQAMLEKTKERQAARLKQKKENMAAKHHQSEQKANEMIREATKMDEMHQKEKERNEQLVRERIEERKMKRQGTNISDRSTPFVIQVAENAAD